jgi:hypothetical protein
MCANQDGVIRTRLTPNVGTDFTGAVVVSRIRQTAQTSPPLIVPTVESIVVALTGELESTHSWTNLQSQALQVPGEKPTDKSRFYFEMDVAYGADPTNFLDRFWTWLNFAPGGIPAGE